MVYLCIMKLVRWLIYSNILISLSAGVIGWGMSHFLGSSDAHWFAITLFGATLFSYNLHRYLRFSDFKASKSMRHQWINNSKSTILALSIAGGLLAFSVYSFFLWDWFSLGILSMSAIITSLYAYRFSGKKSLRELPYIKIYLIVLTWSTVTLLWPMIHTGASPQSQAPVIAIHVCYLFSITIPFDIRDLPYDLPKQRTIPQIIGVQRSKYLALVALFISTGLIGYFYPNQLTLPFLYVTVIGNSYFILSASIEKKEMFYSGWIDGWMIWYGLLWFFN